MALKQFEEMTREELLIEVNRWFAETRKLRKVARTAADMHAACPADSDYPAEYAHRVDAFRAALAAWRK